VKPTGAGAGQLVVGTALDDCQVDFGQCQLGRKHHPRRTCARDNHSVLSLHPASFQGHRLVRSWQDRCATNTLE
jgi:hypothetical protein